MSKSQQPTLSTIQQDQLEEQPIQEGKRTFFIGLTVEILYSVVRAAMVLVLVVLASRIEVETMKRKNGYARMQEVIGLWEKQIILEFRVTNTLNCPEPFEEYTQDQWSGTLEGCLCSTPLGLYNYDLVFRGRCNERQFAHGCLTVPARLPQLYTFWKKDAHLCVRRLKNYNFYSSLSDIINPNGYPPKKCAKGQPYQLDLVSVLQCPVTSLLNGTAMQQPIDDLNFSYNREDDYPVVSFSLTEYAFCQDYSKDNVSPGRKSNYILEAVAKEECGEIDQRIVELDRQDQIAFFGNNPGIEAIIETLPDYPMPDSHFSYKLGYNRYPPWSYTCRQSNSLSLVTTSAFLALSSLYPSFNTCRIALLVLLSLQFLYLMYYWISSYLYLKEKDQQGYLYLKDYQIKKINKRSNIGRQYQNQIIKFVVMQIFGVAVLVISVVAYSKASESQEWVKNAYGCTSDLIKGYLKEYQEFFGAMVVVTMSCVFLTAGVIVLDLLFLLWRRWKGDLQQQQDKTLMQLDIESDDFSSIQPKQLSRIQLEVTEECLVANINTQQTLKEEDRVKKMLFQIDDEIEGSDSSRYSSNPSEKSS